MNGYRLEKKPFYIDREAGVHVFQGISEDSRQPVVAKRFVCTRRDMRDTVTEMNRRLKAALAQSRVIHQSVARISDVRVDITPESYAVVHVFEPFEKCLMTEIEERKRTSRRYTEAEIRAFLTECSQALSFAHSQVTYSQGISHGDFKPSSVFFTSSNSFKITDFGSFSDKKLKTSYPTFTSPQVQEYLSGLKTSYNPFTADVFALGASCMYLSTLTFPVVLSAVDNLEAVVAHEVNVLPYSPDLKAVIVSMLSQGEVERVGMSDIVGRLTNTAVPSEPVLRGKPKIQLLPPPDDNSPKPRSMGMPSRGVTPSSASNQSFGSVSPFTPGGLSFGSSSPFSTGSSSFSIGGASGPQFAVLSRKQVRMYNFETNSWGAVSTLDRSIECYPDSMYAFISAEKLFCCGGFGTVHAGSGNTAYLIETAPDHSRVQVLPEMAEGRSSPGLVYYRDAMYVFAGASSPYTACTSHHSARDAENCGNYCP